MMTTFSLAQEDHFRPLFTLELVTVWVIVSASLLTLEAKKSFNYLHWLKGNWVEFKWNEAFPVFVLLRVCLSVGLLVFFSSIVMLVEGDPMSDISAVILWENNQNSPAPIPGFMDELTSMNFTISISLTRPRKWKTYFGRYYHRHNHNPSVCLLDFRRYVVLSCTLP